MIPDDSSDDGSELNVWEEDVVEDLSVTVYGDETITDDNNANDDMDLDLGDTTAGDDDLIIDESSEESSIKKDAKPSNTTTEIKNEQPQL